MEPFLKRIITGDEKWMKYENIKCKRSWSKADDPPQTISKPGLTKNKVLLSVWYDWKGIVHSGLPEKLQKVTDYKVQYVLDKNLFLIKKCFVQNILLIKPRYFLYDLIYINLYTVIGMYAIHIEE